MKFGLILDAFSCNREEALAIFGYVQRILAINKYAGEKAIPETVKARFTASKTKTTENEQLFSKIDSELAKNFSFTKREMDFIINHDVNFGENGKLIAGSTA